MKTAIALSLMIAAAVGALLWHTMPERSRYIDGDPTTAAQASRARPPALPPSGTLVPGEQPGDEPYYVPAPPLHVAPEDLRDPNDPGRGTGTVIEPGRPTPPDPFVEPNTVVDPEQGRPLVE